jgi:UDP-N-acetylglucosamine acyltransferase
MATVHPTAIISREAELGAGVIIGPYVVIDGPVRLRDRVHVLAQVHLTSHIDVAEDCVIHPFAAIGGPPQDRAFTGERSYCRIGARTVIREGVTIHRGTMPESTTTIGEDCMLMAGSHVAHNCTIGDHVVIINGVLMGGHVQVDHHAVLGGGAMIHQFCRIGEYAMLGGGATVTQNAAPFMCYVDRNVCNGINRIGLRRNGFTKEAIDELHMLYRRLFRSRHTLARSANELRDEVQTDPGKRLLEFVLADSRRGIGRWHA